MKDIIKAHNALAAVTDFYSSALGWSAARVAELEDQNGELAAQVRRMDAAHKHQTEGLMRRMVDAEARVESLPFGKAIASAANVVLAAKAWRFSRSDADAITSLIGAVDALCVEMGE